jgi:two-component system NtrC family response regulator
VRELENRVKRATIMAEGNRIELEDLELAAPKEDEMPLNLREVRERAERQALQRAMGLSHGNMSKAAQMLGVSRPTLYDLLNKFEMK